MARVPNPTGKGGFQKGQSGNPKGRPPAGQSFAEKLRAELAKAHQPGQTKFDRLIEVATALALDGNLQAVLWIADRTDGKVVATTVEDRLVELEALVAELLRAQSGAANGTGYRTLTESDR
jgi:hypothetical protein